MDMPRPGQVLVAARSLLRRDGRLLMSVPNPVTDSTYRFRTVQYRHTLEGWSRMFEEAGLFIARLREPRPTAEALARCPELADAARVPYFLIFELRAR